MKNLLLFLFLSFSLLQAHSQTPAMRGQVKSAADTLGIPGAAVRLEILSDTAAAGAPIVALTDPEGRFSFASVPPGRYAVTIQYLGFSTYNSVIQMQEQPLDMGGLLMESSSLTLGTVEVTGRASMGKQMGDTTQFNAAAFKTSPNANVEDLVEKMPGISMQDGQIQAQGEAVQTILVDGKPFFEGDVEAALKNLPAEIVQNIQIFDKQSDQAEFSGFDDGEEVKAINIVTKPDRRRGVFGQASLGYGTDDRYLTGASVNIFDNERRITVTGVSNDINASRYSIGRTPGSGLRGGGEGNTTTNRISVNYNDEWGEKLEVNGNYSFNHRKQLGEQFSFRDYFLASDSGRAYTEENRRDGTSAGHSLRMRVEYDPNERNELIIRPSLSFDDSDNISYFFGRTINDLGPLNQTENNVRSTGSGFSFGNELNYRHRFEKRGRTFSVSLETEAGADKGDTYRLADNTYYSRENPNERLDQHIRPDENGFSWEANFSYTEPVGENSRIQIQYELGNNRNKSDERAYNRARETGDYSLLDTLLSNTFENRYFTHEIEGGYEYNTEKLEIEVEAQYQRADLQNSQVFPLAYDMERTFHSLLPSLEVEYEFSESQNLELRYRTGTNAPSMRDLQDVIDNSNPLHLRAGNPNLRQSYRNQLSLRYRSFNPETNKVFYAQVEGSLTQHTISNSTLIAEEPIRLSEDIILERGSQFTRPVNLDEDNWDIRTRFSYGQPLAFISSKLELNGSLGRSRRPDMINDELTFSSANDFGMGVSVSSNISEKVDFNVSTRSRYSIVENSLRPQTNQNYFSQSTRLRGNLIFWKGVVFRTELDHRVNAGLSAGYDTNYLLWNISLSKLIFKNERGEICLAVNDLLKQNNNIDRSVTELYIEDERTNLLQRFFMLSFTYNIRHFSGG